MHRLFASFAALALMVGTMGGSPVSATTFAPTSDHAASSLFSADRPAKVSISRGGHAIVEGNVVAVSGSELVVRSWGGDWRILAHSGSILERYDGVRGDHTNFAPGDSVRVEGKTSPDSLTTVHADRVKNRSKHRGGIVPYNQPSFGHAPVQYGDATISRVDPSHGEFWIDQGGQSYKVRADERTRFVFGDRSGGFQDLQPGMKVNLGGLRASDNSNVLALSVSARDINVISNDGDNGNAQVDQSATDNSANDSNNQTDTDVITDNSDQSQLDASDNSVNTETETEDSNNQVDNSIDESGNSVEDTDVSPLGT